MTIGGLMMIHSLLLKWWLLLGLVLRLGCCGGLQVFETGPHLLCLLLRQLLVVLWLLILE